VLLIICHFSVLLVAKKGCPSGVPGVGKKGRVLISQTSPVSPVDKKGSIPTKSPTTRELTILLIVFGRAGAMPLF
jgi:hypothetical protein